MRNIAKAIARPSTEACAKARRIQPFGMYFIHTLSAATCLKVTSATSMSHSESSSPRRQRRVSFSDAVSATDRYVSHIHLQSFELNSMGGMSVSHRSEALNVGRHERRAVGTPVVSSTQSEAQGKAGNSTGKTQVQRNTKPTEPKKIIGLQTRRNPLDHRINHSHSSRISYPRF
jgi:hypothetical protein